ncbi:hypothetical protein [Lacimicrobium sp. SS2-24]|uniref:hypothetical protein n=1 Tax=Lacimicrobium sp. SS2-24 TaxID=2005569 RepID=UPI000B4AF995|nr:hypothetical protein [Lacimicrobium sp. SS2-24]
MKTFGSILAFLWMGASLFFFVAAHAHEQRVYRIGIEDLDYYPLFSSEHGHSAEDFGLLRQILERFARRQGIEFDYVSLPITRFNHWYREKHIDFRLPDNPLWNGSDELDLHYSDALFEFFPTTVVLKSHENLPFEQFQRLGILYGFTPSTHWQQRIESGDVTLVRDRSIRVLVRLLYMGAIDGLDLHQTAVAHYASELGFDPSQLVVAAKAVPESAVAYQMSTLHHEPLLASLNDYLVQEVEEINQLKRLYGLDPNGFSSCRGGVCSF